MVRRFILFLAFAALAGCAPAPEPAKPAFWQIDGPQGERGWLLGTIHALPRPALWRSPAIDRALAEADTLAVEIADLDDRSGMADAFSLLGESDGLPPLSARIDPALKPVLARQVEAAGLTEKDFARTETWSAALRLARADAGPNDAANGIDRAVLALARGKRVVELEGTKAQLGLFDALPEREQRDLLNAVLRDAGHGRDEAVNLVQAWRSGDFATIEAETHRGMLADPELREAVFAARNRAWTARIAADLKAGRRVFVAVGAAHMAGPDGLAALLTAQGFTVERVQ